MVPTHDEYVEIVMLSETRLIVGQLTAHFNICPNIICNLLYKYQKTGSISRQAKDINLMPGLTAFENVSL